MLTINMFYILDNKKRGNESWNNNIPTRGLSTIFKKVPGTFFFLLISEIREKLEKSNWFV